MGDDFDFLPSDFQADSFGGLTGDEDGNDGPIATFLNLGEIEAAPAISLGPVDARRV